VEKTWKIIECFIRDVLPFSFFPIKQYKYAEAMKTQGYTLIEKALAELTRRIDNLEKRMDEQHQLAPGWFDTEEVCRRFGITKRTVDKFRKLKKVPSSKLGGRVYFRGSDFETILEENLDFKP